MQAPERRVPSFIVLQRNPRLILLGLLGERREIKPYTEYFDGDRRMDAAVFRPLDGFWHVLNSSNNQLRSARWGLASDKRVTGDFDGDGRDDFAIYRDSLWAVIESSNNQPPLRELGFKQRPGCSGRLRREN